jgi:hypothetical protein
VRRWTHCAPIFTHSSQWWWLGGFTAVSAVR